MEECKATNQLDFLRNIFIVIGVKEILTARAKMYTSLNLLFIRG